MRLSLSPMLASLRPLAVLTALSTLSLGACGKKPPEPAAVPDAAPAATPDAAPAATPDAAPTAAPDAAPTAAPDAAPAPAPDAAPAPADAAAPAPDDAAEPAPDAEPAAADAAAPAAADAAEPESPPEAWTLSPPLAVPAATPTTGACIPGLRDEMGLGFYFQRLDGRALELCRPQADSPDEYACWRLDLDKAVVTKAPPSKEALAYLHPSETPKRVLPPQLEVSEDLATAHLLVDGKKTKLDLGGVPAGVAAQSGDLLFIAPSAFSEPPPADGNAIAVFDKSGARLAKIPLADFESTCPVVSWAGSVLFIEAGVCAGPGAVGFLVDPKTGKKLGLLGGATNSASAYGVHPIDLGGNEIAFREQYGHAIFVHDGQTGGLVKRLNLSATLRKSPDGYLLNSPEEGEMWLLDGALVVTQGGGSGDRVVFVDPKAGAITKLLELQPCK